LPCLFAFLPNKEKASYQTVAQHLLKEDLIIPGSTKIKTFTTDFEVGLINSFRETFPQIDIVGCFFHWAQAILKHRYKGFSLSKEEKLCILDALRPLSFGNLNDRLLIDEVKVNLLKELQRFFPLSLLNFSTCSNIKDKD
jgi:hypothetical protein